MRIGIDFDGVICDTIPAMIAYATSRHGLTLSVLDCIAANGPAGLTAEQYAQLIVDTHRTEYQFEMQPMADVVDVLQRLADTHDLFVITARRDAGLDNAVRWAERNGLSAHIQQFVSAGGTTKAALCESLRLDVLIDDFERNLDGLPATVLPILWHADYNAEALIAPPRERIESWAAIRERLEVPH